jgi:hypothetical protein
VSVADCRLPIVGRFDAPSFRFAVDDDPRSMRLRFGNIFFGGRRRMTRDDHEGRIAELNTRYPYLFAGPHIGHHVPPGWLSIVSELCAQIDRALTEAERPLIYFTQIKEKFGGLRVYVNIAPLRIDILGDGESPGISGYVGEGAAPSLFNRLSPLIHAAEEESYRTCIFCGAAWHLRREDRSWVLTLCDRHDACTYDHLDAAFELVTDPQRDLVPPTMEEVAATFLADRMMLRDLGVLHLAVLPPVGKLAPYRLVLTLAEASQISDVLQAATPRVGWPLNATTLEHLAVYADRPKAGDGSWIF